MSLDKKLIALGPAAAGTRTSDLGSDPFGDGNCICWIDFESSVEDETGTQTLTANGSITLTTDQVMFDTTSGYFDSTGAKDIPNKDSITFPTGDSGLSDIDGWTNSDDFSLSVWVYWEGLNNPSSEQQGVGAIASITNGTGIMCRIYFGDQSNANKPSLSSFGDNMNGDTALNVDAWNHLVFISPATDSSTESAEIYLNGTRVGYAVNWTRSSRNYYDVIGATFNTVNNNSQYFNGYMDNLRIFKDRLTVSEVESLYNEGTTPVYADFLVVAGGGGGGNYAWGAGGGAGGLRTSYGSTNGGGAGNEPRLTLTSGTTYTITVGAANANANGTDSSIAGSGLTTITSTGGGRGGFGLGGGTQGSSGGSGGGTAGTDTSSGGAGTANQGFAGGAGTADTGQSAGGGGGAGGVGTNAAANSSGNGGGGVSISITGSAVTYAGGGGGGVGRGDLTSETGGTGGSSVGGNGGRNTYYGGSNSANPTTGAVNTGSGGGGGIASGNSSNSGGGAAGGSGIVVLRLPTADYSGTTTGSPTVTTSGSDTIMKFTGSGTYVH